MLEEADNGPIKVLMKRGSVKPRRVVADLGNSLGECFATGREKVEMTRGRHEVNFRWGVQARFQIVDGDLRHDPIVFGLPKLHRCFYRGETARGKRIAGRGPG